MATADPAVRLLVLTENYPPDRGGMANSCDRITRGLRSRGVAIDIVHFTRRASSLMVEHQQSGDLVRVPVDDDPSHSINVLWASWAKKNLGCTHLVSFGGLLPVLAGPAFSAWLGIPLVTLLRGNDFDTGVFSLRRGWALREALRESRLVCTVSREHEERVRNLVPGAEVSVVPNGIDLSDWSLLGDDIERGRVLRESLDIGDRQVIGVFGHLKRKKGVSLLVDAVRRSGVADRIHLLLVGELEPAVEEELDAAIGDELQVTRLPFRDRWELLPCFAACDVVAIPSIYDGMPNVLLEAGALGMPILASTAGGIPDLLVHGQNAILFETGDPHDARRAVETVATMPRAELEKLGDSLAQTVRGELTSDIETSRYVELFTSISSTVDTPRSRGV